MTPARKFRFPRDERLLQKAMSAEPVIVEQAARRSHRDAVYDKAANATRPEPVPLTEELCVEVAGEHPRSARVIELLFTSLEPLPALLLAEARGP